MKLEPSKPKFKCDICGITFPYRTIEMEEDKKKVQVSGQLTFKRAVGHTEGYHTEEVDVCRRYRRELRQRYLENLVGAKFKED
jgi:hypothetical protein